VLQTVIHTVFILSALGIAFIDRLSQPVAPYAVPE